MFREFPTALQGEDGYHDQGATIIMTCIRSWLRFVDMRLSGPWYMDSEREYCLGRTTVRPQNAILILFLVLCVGIGRFDE